MERWSINDSAKIYNNQQLGAELFSIDKKGNLCVHPSPNSKYSIELKSLVDDLIKRKIQAADPVAFHEHPGRAHPPPSTVFSKTPSRKTNTRPSTNIFPHKGQPAASGGRGDRQLRQEIQHGP
jgi:hypothetical protein